MGLDVEHIVDGGKEAAREPRGSRPELLFAGYTTTNVSRRGRRAVGLPPRQRSWAAWEA